MTKKHALAFLSTAVLLQASAVMADEVLPPDPTTPSTVVIPPASTEGGETSSTLPADPTIPSEVPTTPSSQDTPSESSDSGVTSEPKPSEPAGTVTEGGETVLEEPKPADTGATTPPTATPDKSETVEVPTTDGGVATVKPDTSTPTNNPNISAESAKTVGASQVGTTSTVTGQIVRDVTTANPIALTGGLRAVDIRDGLVTLDTGAKVSPESAGLTKNTDGTYSAKTETGELVTLPETGQAPTSPLVAFGFALMSLAGMLVKKRFNHLF